MVIRDFFQRDKCTTSSSNKEAFLPLAKLPHLFSISSSTISPEGTDVLLSLLLEITKLLILTRLSLQPGQQRSQAGSNLVLALSQTSVDQTICVVVDKHPFLVQPLPLSQSHPVFAKYLCYFILIFKIAASQNIVYVGRNPD